jgi:hypothetical protein
VKVMIDSMPIRFLVLNGPEGPCRGPVSITRLAFDENF